MSQLLNSVFSNETFKAIIALAYVLVVFSIGDIISVKTKSIVSMLFTCSVIFLLGFWAGIPTDLFASSQLLSIGALIIPMLLAHMGTMLNLQQLKEQWRTVLIAVAAIAGVVAFLLLVGSPIIGRNAALIAAPPLAGGVVAGIQMADAARAIGNESYAVLATLLVVVQGFVGYPVASFCLRREAKGVLTRKAEITEQNQRKHAQAADATSAGVRVENAFLSRFKSENIMLAKTALVALLATLISVYAQRAVGFNILDKNVLALLLGVVAHETGFLEKSILTKANSSGLAMAALMTVIFNNLSTATPQLVLELLPTILIALGLGTVGIVIFSMAASKILKVSPYMGMAIGVSALFGFPGTFIISNEVSKAASNDPEEQKLVLDEILPRMLVAGFITVSIASVVLAGILSPMVR